jgi:hypothetical protein
LIVDELQVRILNPVEVVISSPPGDNDCVGAAVIPHVALDLGGGVLDD